jgi:RNA polymerase sigma-70 factor (ECF subfamily)
MRVQEQSTGAAAELSGNALVQQALAGDQQAFEALVQRYSAALFRLAYRYVGEREEASDVLQQVWLQLYLALHTLQVKGSIKPWLFRVAHNCSVDTLCRKRALMFSEVEAEASAGEDSWLDSFPDTRPTPEEVAEGHELQHPLQLAIRALPRKQRPVVLLYYEGQLDTIDIGRLLGRPPSTVRTQFSRAKAVLRTTLTA